MFFKRLMKPRPAQIAAESLYSGAVAQARTPALYTTMAVPDTREGRFELYSLHIILLMDRLRGQGPQAEETSQALVDRFTRGLDDAFRELGVGDLSVAKRIKKLAEAFLGRARAVDQAFEGLPDRRSMVALLARTLFDGDDARSSAMADYLVRARESLAGQPLDILLDGDARWPTL
ncbi:MAG: ubiquinol-cytochrome C reductase [Caulobacter sp.]|nr:ubiquinol-cytochrome C reductase [Caulobacter sp.]